ncbi:MAG: peptidoglycan DD-metalloendopeptidase family protein [Chloroflexi bacterium]|nr:peptidoglycan DD-metalloendopeptidase family protein [Chloroflexota bacterium]
MRRDRFIGPLSLISAIALVGVKALSAIIFVSFVLVVGINRQKNGIAVEPTIQPVVISNPLPDISFGMFEMPFIAPTPTVALTPTSEFTNTVAASETSLPSSTFLPTSTITVTNTAIATNTNTPQATSTSAPISTSTLEVASTQTPFATNLPIKTPTLLATSTLSPAGGIFLLSSPLQGISTNELATIITQKFEAPAVGEDSGHHGVDLAFWKRGNLDSILGVPIQTIFSGKVASAYNKIRNPYGYMVIIETPLSELPKNIVDAMVFPTVTTPATASNRLTCPTGFTDWWSTSSQSLYILYGHMNNPPSVKLGDVVKIGDILGQVGNSGASSNPHLHVEMRIGPSNASFTSMAHYVATATDLEMHNYCMWRISGQFKMMDPMELLNLTK